MNHQREHERRNHAGKATLLVLFAAFAAAASSQSLRGTMTTVLEPSGKSAEEEYQRLKLDLSKGGLSEQALKLSEAELRHTAARIAEGLRCEGTFEYDRVGSSTWATFPVASTAIGSTQAQNIEAFDGSTTILHDGTTLTVHAGDRRTFTGNPLWMAALFGEVQGWLKEVSASQSDGIETVTYEAVDDQRLWHRLTVKFRGQGRSSVASVDYGYVTPEQFRRPGQGEYTRAGRAVRSADGSSTTFEFFVGGRVHQTVALSQLSDAGVGEFSLLRGVKSGTPVVDLRLGDRAPVNYVFAGSLPPLDSIRSRPIPSQTDGFGRAGLLGAGLLGLVASFLIWKRS